MAKDNASRDSRPTMADDQAKRTLDAYRAAHSALVAAINADASADKIAELEQAEQKVLADLAAHKPLASKDEQKKLFTSYDAAQKAWLAAKAAVEQAIEVRSKAVEDILLRCGKGPFNFNGMILTVTKRGATYFFKSPSKNEITEV